MTRKERRALRFKRKRERKLKDMAFLSEINEAQKSIQSVIDQAREQAYKQSVHES